MRFFKRTPAPVAAVAEAAVVDLRKDKPPYLCANCRLNRPPAVFMENGNYYCKPCAVRCYELLHIRPAGRRAEDITLAQLIS